MSAVQKLSATVAALRGVYDEITPEMNPDGDPLFEVAFETAEGVKLFWINSFQYYALHVGMQGELTFQGNHLISFGDVLHA
ncbi:MAG: hypothetical protein K2H85_07335 [Allobaculum sp.]|nr:hypothetical protein [Allobaculum sp.]